MESAASSTNMETFEFVRGLKNLRSTLEKKCSDPLLLRMLEEGLHADITLNAQGGSIKAHRSVLASASPVFQAMFQHDMKEHLTSTIDLPDINIKSLQLFLLLLYITNERTKDMPELNTLVDMHFDELYDVAEKFMVVARLKVVLLAALDRHLTPGNCWDYFNKTKHSLLSGEGATQVCYAYVKKNFKEVMKSESTRLAMKQCPRLVQNCIMDYLESSSRII